MTKKKRIFLTAGFMVLIVVVVCAALNYRSIALAYYRYQWKRGGVSSSEVCEFLQKHSFRKNDVETVMGSGETCGTSNSFRYGTLLVTYDSKNYIADYNVLAADVSNSPRL